jgi:hypothetical protein
MCTIIIVFGNGWAGESEHCMVLQAYRISCIETHLLGSHVCDFLRIVKSVDCLSALELYLLDLESNHDDTRPLEQPYPEESVKSCELSYSLLYLSSIQTYVNEQKPMPSRNSTLLTPNTSSAP